MEKKETKIPELRFPEFEGEWVEKRLGEIAQTVGGGTPDTTKKEYWNGNIIWLTPTEIKEKYISDSERKITNLGLQKSSAKVVEDPWTKKPICLLPSCNPDIVFIHVPRADKFGNCQYDGYVVEDFELARAARKLIITTEKIIDNEEIRKKPWETLIPGIFVDAVVEVKYGSHPCNMPGQYYFDEVAISEWLEMSKTDEGLKEWLDKYVFGVSNFEEYLELNGGEEKMKYLYELEHYRAELKAPWLDKKLGKKGGK